MSDCSLFYLPTWYILCHYFFSSFLPSEFPESNATSADGRSSFKRGMEKRRLVWYYKTFSLLNRSYLDTAHILSIVDVFFWQKFLLLTDSDLAKDKTIFLSSSSFFSWNAVSTVFHSLQTLKIHFMETDMLWAMIFPRDCYLILKETSLEYKGRWDCDRCFSSLRALDYRQFFLFGIVR